MPDPGWFWNLKPSERPVLQVEGPDNTMTATPSNDFSSLSPKGPTATDLSSCTWGKKDTPTFQGMLDIGSSLTPTPGGQSISTAPLLEWEKWGPGRGSPGCHPGLTPSPCPRVSHVDSGQMQFVLGITHTPALGLWRGSYQRREGQAEGSETASPLLAKVCVGG